MSSEWLVCGEILPAWEATAGESQHGKIIVHKSHMASAYGYISMVFTKVDYFLCLSFSTEERMDMTTLLEGTWDDVLALLSAAAIKKTL